MTNITKEWKKDEKKKERSIRTHSMIPMRRCLYLSLICSLCIVMASLFYGMSEQVKAAEDDTLKRIIAEYDGKEVERGEKISEDDITVYAYYYGSNSKTKLEDGSFTISPDVMRSSTRQLVTVTYTENGITKTTTVSVPCKRGSLKSITAVYVGTTGVVGSKVETSDIKVTAELNDGFREKVEDFTVEDHILQPGDNVLNISYTESGITCITNLVVYAMEATLSRIEANYIGGVTGINGYINPAEIQVTAYYRDKKKSYGRDVIKKAVTGITVFPYSLKEGNNSITVVYMENGVSVETRVNVPAMKNAASWELVDGKWKYHDSMGNYYTSRWLYIDGAWYYFGKDGFMQSDGWIHVDDIWYYLDAQGRCMIDGETPDGWFVDGFGAWIE